MGEDLDGLREFRYLSFETQYSLSQFLVAQMPKSSRFGLNVESVAVSVPEVCNSTVQNAAGTLVEKLEQVDGIDEVRREETRKDPPNDGNPVVLFCPGSEF
ncbi:hypothetical protein [Halegenticoccus soli]|uniref:hypothetical protein n=1 Tax=Halegenticoccus soli TaxID=1985678 RepID=UPI00117A3BC5|nr:hypothetical protein [Halegenticoccus soli]